MRITHDTKFDLMYIKFSENEVGLTKRVTEDVVLDFDVEGRLVGMELLNTAYFDVPETIEVQDITHQRYRELEKDEPNTSP